MVLPSLKESATNATNRDVAAMTAEPIAIPLVMAFVVFPTASRSARYCLACGSSWAISPTPFALSTIGPKESMETVLPVSVSMPIPVRATPYAIIKGDSPQNITVEEIIAPAMAMMDQTLLSSPLAIPDRITVAAPVSVASPICCTGLYLSDVKYSVRWLMARARIMPASVARKSRNP